MALGRVEEGTHVAAARRRREDHPAVEHDVDRYPVGDGQVSHEEVDLAASVSILLPLDLAVQPRTRGGRGRLPPALEVLDPPPRRVSPEHHRPQSMKEAT